MAYNYENSIFNWKVFGLVFFLFLNSFVLVVVWRFQENQIIKNTHIQWNRMKTESERRKEEEKKTLTGF